LLAYRISKSQTTKIVSLSPQPEYELPFFELMCNIKIGEHEIEEVPDTVAIARKSSLIGLSSLRNDEWRIAFEDSDEEKKDVEETNGNHNVDIKKSQKEETPDDYDVANWETEKTEEPYKGSL